MPRPARPRDRGVVAPLLALIIVLGFFPKPVLDVINPAVDQTMLSTSACTDPAPAVGDAAEGAVRVIATVHRRVTDDVHVPDDRVRRARRRC